MADPVLTPGQYSIGTDGSSSALVFGAGTNGLWIANTATDTGSLTVQDQAVTGHDGMLFGVDTLPGMVVTQTGQAWIPGQGQAALDAYSALAGAWNAPSVRLANGAVQVLRAYYPVANSVRRCYGRGRQIIPSYGRAAQGLVQFTSNFQAADGTWYSDSETTLELTQVPSFSGGLTPPLTPPYQLASQTNFQTNTAENAGTLPTWPVITFTGPVSYPGISYVNTPVTISYNGIIPAGKSLVVDTRPWARTALLNGVSVAGFLSGDPMIGLQLQPGATVVHFAGQDYTGTSVCTVTWRNATLAIGGTE